MAPLTRFELEFAAMLWGPGQLPQFESVVKPGYADCLLGFNE